MKPEPADTFAQIKPDIIYWRYNKKKLLKTIRAAKGFGIPFVFAISSKQDPQLFGWRFNKKKTVIKTVLNIAEQIVSSVWNYFGFLQVDAVTSLNSRYIKYVPVKNKRVVYNTVYKEQGDIVSPQKPYVLWVANLKSTKRPEAFIDLAKRMKDSDLHFIMIGRMDITYQRYVENAERELANFKYIGGASPLEVNALLKTALCLVHTCKPEGFGNIFIQSWFQGCPTISYTFDPDNFIQLHGLGFVSGNLGRLAKDIKKIKNNPVLRQKLSDNSIHTATKFFDQNRLGNQLEDLFQELCLPKDQNKHMT